MNSSRTVAKNSPKTGWGLQKKVFHTQITNEAIDESNYDSRKVMCPNVFQLIDSKVIKTVDIKVLIG